MIHRGRAKNCNILYKNADEFFSINDGDVDLDPIHIRLPKPPPYHLIDGFGLPHDEQYFRRLEIPDRLKDMERKAKAEMRAREDGNKAYKATAERVIQAFWKVFNNERQTGYDYVIEWLKEVHWHRKHGYWFFNDGKPTWISGDHFDYLNFWMFPDEASRDGGRPEYRDIDRIVYAFRHYAKQTTEKVWMDEDGSIYVEDAGLLICYGTVEPKSRRCGITSQGTHEGVKDAMSGFSRYFTIVSMDGDNAETHFIKKLVPAFKKYPLWLKPLHNNQLGNRILFDSTSQSFDVEYLGSVADYTDSAGERKNDGDKLHRALFDEEGKSKGDILERWNVNKQAMALGARIVGFSMHPTTVEEMDEGGQQYMYLCQQSKFYDRGEQGQTTSGLFEIFVPAYRRLEGFIDRFGMSVVDTPTERQIRLRPEADFARFNMGAKEYLQSKLDRLLEIGTPDALETHRSTRRKFPMRYADLWIGSSGDLGFDMDIIDSRLAEIRRKNPVRLGRFEWVNGFGGDVMFVDDDNGPFELSKMLPPDLQNKRIKEYVTDMVTGEPREQWTPANKYDFTASADAFKAGTSNDSKKMGVRTRQSDGGLAVLWEYDEAIDHDKPSIQEWESNRFACSYRYRPPSLEEYQEDALKMCIYFGAPMYPERNVGDIDLYFIKVGFGGYLLYDIDPTTGARAERAGFASYERKKTELFLAIKDYIRFRGHKECHASFLEEVKSIQGTEQMNKYDRLTAHGGCLLGSKQNERNRRRFDSRKVSDSDISAIMKFFSV